VLGRPLSTPAICIALVTVAATLVSLGPSSLDFTATSGVILVVMSLAFYVFSGISGVVSFGQLAFAAVGGYVTAWLTMPVATKQTILRDAPAWVRELQVAPLLAVVLAGTIAAGLAVIFSLPLMRLSGLQAGLATVALLLIAETVASGWGDMTRGNRGLSDIPSSGGRWVMLGWAAATIAVVWLYQTSRFGVRLRASSQDGNVARAVGIDVHLERGIAFVLSGFLMGVGGALYVQHLGSVIPDLFYLDLSFLIIAMVVLGGISSMSGAVVGTVVLTVVQEVLRRAENGSLLGLLDIPRRPGLTRVGLAVVLLLVLWRRPGGVLGARELVWRRRPSDRVVEPASVAVEEAGEPAASTAAPG
jgi:branched-chain amino acid transport system permease protein